MAVPSHIGSVAVVAHHDDVVGLLAVEPGVVGAELTVVTSLGVDVDRVGPWAIRGVLRLDPRHGWEEPAALVRADLVVFVAGARPAAGWLGALIEAFESDPDLGAAQPAVVDVDGRSLAHAGALAFRDGSLRPYGAGAHWVDAPPYACRRHADALSGRVLAVRGSLLSRLDVADLTISAPDQRAAAVSFGVRDAGLRTLYVPESRVAATTADPASDDASTHRFVERWSQALALQPAPVTTDDQLHALAHAPQGGFGPGETLRNDWTGPRVMARHASRIWMVDPATLTFDRDTGHLRAWRIVAELRAQGHQVIYTADHAEQRNGYVAHLSRLGVMSWGATRIVAVHPEPARYLEAFRPGVAEMLAQHPVDLVWLSFHYLVPRYLPDIRAYAPGVPVVLDTVDVHHVREAREAEVLGRADLAAAAAATRRRELAACRAVDAVVCVTEDDAQVIRSAVPDADVHIVSVVNAVEHPGPGFDERDGLFFVASFVPTPNGDAVRWYRDEIKPLVDRRTDALGLPRIRLTVAGNDPAGEAAAVAGPGIDVIGRIPEVLPHLHAARVSIAPLRWGAGIKGKVCEALAAGLPVVGTSVAFEGLDVVDGDHGLVADDAEAFAEAVVRLHSDRTAWERVRALAPPMVDAAVGLGRLRRALGPLLEVSARPRVRRVHVDVPGPAVAQLVTVVVHADDDAASVAACVANVRAGAVGPVEVVVVDDALVEPIDARPLGADVVVVRSEERLGYVGAIELGLTRARGEFVVLAGSEVLLGPGWAAGVRHVLSDPGVGALGFRTNLGTGAARAELGPYRSDQAFGAAVAVAGAELRDPMALSDVAALDISGVALRRSSLEILDGALDTHARRPWLGLVRAGGLRLVVADGLHAHRQHEGPTRLDVAPRPLWTAPSDEATGVVPVLAAVVVAGDARDALAPLTASLDGVVDALVWGDTGSTDGTPAVARLLGWTVVDVSTAGPDADAVVRRAAGTPWVVQLHPGEVLVPRRPDALRDAVVGRHDTASGRLEVVLAAPTGTTPAWRSRRTQRRVLPTVTVLDDVAEPFLVTGVQVGALAAADRPAQHRTARRRLAAAARLGAGSSSQRARAEAALLRAEALELVGHTGAALDAAHEALSGSADWPEVSVPARRLAARLVLALDDPDEVEALLASVPDGCDDDSVRVVRAARHLAAGDLAATGRELAGIDARADRMIRRVVAPALSARAELAGGRRRDGWRRLHTLAGRAGGSMPAWAELIARCPASTPLAELASEVVAARAQRAVLDALADADAAQVAPWLALLGVASDPAEHDLLVAGELLAVDPTAGPGLRGMADEAVGRAAADAVVRARLRDRRRHLRPERDLSIVVVASDGAPATLSWLEQLVAAGHPGRYQLVLVDDAGDATTRRLLDGLAGQLEVVHLPVRTRLGRALVEGLGRSTGGACLLTTTAQPVDAEVLAGALDAAAEGRAGRLASGAAVAPTRLLLDQATLDELATDLPAVLGAVVASATAAGTPTLASSHGALSREVPA